MPRVNMDTLEVSREYGDTTAEQDVKKPYIRDITVLDVDGVQTTVLTDHNNMCVKAFHTKNNEVFHSRLQLNNKPWGITPLGDDKVMVVVPDTRQIVTVAVTPNLVHLTHIQVEKRYYILATLTLSRLAVVNGDSLDILNMQGEVITTCDNIKLFRSPFLMCVSNKGHILVTDQIKETVNCLTSEGQTLWIYSGTREGKLTCPRGITTDGGDILVADCYLRKVIQLSHSGEYVRDVLTSQDGLMYPESICLDKHGILYVCDNGELLKYVFKD